MMPDRVFLCDRRAPGFESCGGSRLRKVLLAEGRWEHPGEAPLELDKAALACLAESARGREMALMGPVAPFGVWVAIEAEGSLLVGYLTPANNASALELQAPGIHVLVLVHRDPLALLSCERARPPVYSCSGWSLS